MKVEIEDLRSRTKRFALSTINLSMKLPKTDEVTVIKKQLLRSATSVATQYREAGRTRSNAEFISKWNVACRNWMSLPYGIAYRIIAV